MNIKSACLVVILAACSEISFSQLVFEKSEYTARREKLMERVPDGIVIFRGAPAPTGNDRFVQFNNMFYFTGMEVSDLILAIDGKEKTSTLFFTITEKEAKNEGIPVALVNDPVRFNGVQKVLPYDKFTAWLSDRVNAGNAIYTMFKCEELQGEISGEKTNSLKVSMTNEEWDGRLTREMQFVKLLGERYPGLEVKDCSSFVSDLRKIKSPAEREIMREAGRIGTAAHLAFIRATRAGVREVDLANLFESICKKEGAHGLAYTTIIMSAENIPYGHYSGYNRTLKDGDFVVLDAGPDYYHYDIDFSTSFPVSGKFTPKQKIEYEIANQIREVCIKSYRPGITLKEVGQNVRQFLLDKGYDPEEPRFRGLIRYGGYNHSVGMAVHDGMGTFNGPDEVLQEGFVFACDIQNMLPDLEIGIRIEDTVIITKDGCEVLSAGLPRTINEIEKLMNNHPRMNYDN